MTSRWQVLASLFGGRVAMAFQFQAVAALSPLIMDEFDVRFTLIFGIFVTLVLSVLNSFIA